MVLNHRILWQWGGDGLKGDLYKNNQKRGLNFACVEGGVRVTKEKLSWNEEGGRRVD